MHPWMIGLGCLAVGLYGTASGRDRAGAGRWTLTGLGWIPFVLWLISTLDHAWRTP